MDIYGAKIVFATIRFYLKLPISDFTCTPQLYKNIELTIPVIVTDIILSFEFRVLSRTLSAENGHWFSKNILMYCNSTNIKNSKVFLINSPLSNVIFRKYMHRKI